ncbi:N-formylglutamate amidohydrolase [Erythrobacter litoralis]|uniref:N-formylglutamate amidohydrolase n=1 Tax=Erythrobacter litoralis TaxID=39960 RepID=UPI0006743CCE|nr:N-formylglutamate amidohydrolase [Erythrobacter litoralis]
MVTDTASEAPEAPDIPTIPGSAHPAYRAQVSEKPELPVLIAVPHAGRVYPESIRQRMRSPEYAMKRLEDRMVDRLAEAIVAETDAPLIVAYAPRAMLDLNRAPDDMDWSMVAGARDRGRGNSRANRRARSGLGLVPRRLHGLGEIWRDRLTQADLDARVETIHEPYHRAVADTLSHLRRRWGAALLLDLHSMPPLKKRHPDDKPAEFVIGDRFGASSHGSLTAAALHFLGQQGRRVAHNRPYAGGYVLDRHGKPSVGIHAMQLEICRSLYLDARHEEPSARLPALARMLAGLVQTLAAEVVPPARDHGLPLAAE